MFEILLETDHKVRYRQHTNPNRSIDRQTALHIYSKTDGANNDQTKRSVCNCGAIKQS